MGVGSEAVLEVRFTLLAEMTSEVSPKVSPDVIQDVAVAADRPEVIIVLRSDMVAELRLEKAVKLSPEESAGAGEVGPRRCWYSRSGVWVESFVESFVVFVSRIFLAGRNSVSEIPAIVRIALLVSFESSGVRFCIHGSVVQTGIGLSR